MRIKQLTFCIVLMTAFAGCGPQPQEAVQTVTEEIDYYENIIPELKACIMAHGGLDKWRSYGTLEYDRRPTNGGDHQLIDLYSRKVLLKNDTAYTIGYDGKEVWITPDMETMKNPRFFHNLYFYFFSFPFVVADPGSIQEYLGETTFNGKNYKKIKITYGDGVGDAPEDQYILWIDAETNLLDFINYSVTYFDASRAERYNALDYSGWEQVNGMTVPNEFTSYRWENDSLGEKRGVTKFENITFTKEQPEGAIFEMPEGAMIDKLDSETE